jgi:flavin reductase (DIM6/NTAB) family NADH-FMN oxidoreductase RutF
MSEDKPQWLKLDTRQPIWENFFTVAPLVVIGTREGEGFDLAPKHMAMPLGYDNYFGFICTPRHSTYHNVQREEGFTVSFPKPGQIVVTSLSASPREGTDNPGKPIIQKLPTVEAPGMDGIFLRDSYLNL